MRVFLQLAQVAILARILSPSDYGLMAIVSVVLGFAGLFADLGVNSAYVQRQEITQEQRSSLFWLNVLVSGGMTMLVVALSPLFARFFGDPRLSTLIMLSASVFVLSALGQQLRMSAEKRLDFRPVVLLEIVAATIAFATAVVGALSGWGVYSLIASGVVSSVVSSILAWIFIANGWRPLWRLQIADLRPFFAFGGAVLADGIVGQVNRTIDVFLGGRLLSVTELGLYSVPRNLTLQLQLMVNPIITRVGFPLIAKVQSDVARVRSIYLKTMNMTASTNAPLYIGVAFFAPEIISLLLGEGWGRSADLMRILALWGGVRSVGNPVGSLTSGMGRPGLALKWNIFLVFIFPPVMWLGALRGPEGIAWALLGLQVALFVPAWYYLIRPLCHASLGEYSISALRPFALAILAIAPAFILVSIFQMAIVRLLVGGFLSVLFYFVVSYKVNYAWIQALIDLSKYGEGKR